MHWRYFNLALSYEYMDLLILMGKCKKDVTPVQMQWSYAFLALTHQYDIAMPVPVVFSQQVTMP